MRKSFRAFLIEQEKEYTYWVKSIANIHDIELMGRIGMAVSEFKMIRLDRSGNRMIRARNDDFPAFPNTRTYVLKAVLATEPRCRTLHQLVRLWTGINEHKIKVEKEGGEVNAPVAASDIDFNSPGIEGAQEDVGDRRVGKFMQELESLRKARLQKMWERPIYERFTVSHHSLSRILQREARRGFYLVERHDNGIRVVGPFAQAPDNYEFVDTLPGGLKLLHERQVDGRSLMEFEPSEDMELREPAGVEDKDEFFPYWEVEVVDTDRGKTFQVVVRAGRPVDARNRGIEQVARQHGMDAAVLLATKPKADEGSDAQTN